MLPGLQTTLSNKHRLLRALPLAYLLESWPYVLVLLFIPVSSIHTPTAALPSCQLRTFLKGLIYFSPGNLNKEVNNWGRASWKLAPPRSLHFPSPSHLNISVTATLLLAEGRVTALQEQKRVIAPKAKHGVASSAGLQDKAWEKRGLQCSIATAQNWMMTSSRSWWTEKEQRWPVPSRYQERLPFYLFPLKMAATSYRSQLGGGQLLEYCSRSPARGVAGAGQWGAAAVPWEVPRVEGSKEWHELAFAVWGRVGKGRCRSSREVEKTVKNQIMYGPRTLAL